MAPTGATGPGYTGQMYVVCKTEMYLAAVSPSPNYPFLSLPKFVFMLAKFALIWFFNLCKLIKLGLLWIFVSIGCSKYVLV